MKFNFFHPLFFLAIFFFTSKVSASDLIDVYADYDKVIVKNTYQYTLKVFFIRPNDKYEIEILKPGQETSFSGKFNKRKLKNYTIALKYDDETYAIDKRTIEITRDNIIRERERKAINNAITNFLAELAGESDYAVIRWVGKAYSGAQDINAGLNIYNQIQAGDYEGAKGSAYTWAGTKAAVELSGALASEMKLNKGFTKGTSAAIISLAQDLADNEMPQCLLEYQKGAAILYHDNGFYLRNTHFLDEALDRYSFPKYLPNVILGIKPFTPGNTFDGWQKPDERIFKNEDGNDDELEWAEGPINRTFSVNVAFPISPEIGTKGIHSKMFLNLSYSNVAYGLKEGEAFLLGGKVIEGIPNDFYDLIIKPNKVTFNHNTVNVGLMLRLGNSSAFSFDLEGGYSYNRGFLRFPDGGEHLFNGREPLSKNIAIFEPNSYNPYGGVRIGLGMDKVHWTFEGVFSQPNFTLSENYQLHRVTSIDEINNTYTHAPQSIELDGRLLFKINIGFSFLF